MMLQSCLVLLALALWSQGSLPPSPVPPAGCLTDLDKKRLSTEAGIEKRIRICKEISDRFHKDVEQAEKKQAAEGVSVLLACWSDHLTVALKDIEANINRKKRSGALKDFEIHLRKSIRDMEDSRLKTPYQEISHYDAWLEQANVVRKKFVDILFQR
jgi:hypothetical protein